MMVDIGERVHHGNRRAHETHITREERCACDNGEGGSTGKGDRRMKSWLRRVTPDLFLAAVIALVITMALHTLDALEKRRIDADAQILAGNGLTIDERIDVLDDSIRRSTVLYLPMLAGFGGAVAGLASRRRRWAWLTAIGAIIPALVIGAGFFVDTPIPGGMATATYVLIAVSLATAAVSVRNRFLPRESSPS
jgi:hypothetical protein